MSADRQPPRHRRAGLLRRLTSPLPDTTPRALAPVPHEPPPTALLPGVPVRPVGAMVPGSIVPTGRGLHGAHATEVLPALRQADHDRTQVIAFVHPDIVARDREYAAMRAAGDRLLAELKARHDVLLNAFDEQVAAEGEAWDAIAVAAETQPDLSPWAGMGARLADVDQKIDVWVNSSPTFTGIKRFNRDRVNAHWEKVVSTGRDAHTEWELWATAAVKSAEVALARWEAIRGRGVQAPTDTVIPKLTPALLSALDAVKAAEDRVHAARVEAGEAR